MMILIILIALLALIFGLLFLFSPQTLKKMNKKASQVISKTDDAFLKNRVPVGIILLAGSLIMFYLAITIMIR
ncbi:MAG: hypothetical protein AABY79_03865 [Nitrospirota bacterium]|nr:hypothetical protein [Nitrospirota bacterium]